MNFFLCSTTKSLKSNSSLNLFSISSNVLYSPSYSSTIFFSALSCFCNISLSLKISRIFIFKAFCINWLISFKLKTFEAVF